ncbi:MAG: 2-amino-4-hydroxy-6-hydroxymethyldihydropteridine diphosphokinase [Rhizobiaceae bacterium]
MSKTSPRAWLGLGGNIGDVQNALVAALQGLQQDSQVEIVMVSSMYKTPPWGLEDQPWFLNCCVELETNLTPHGLLDLCKKVEQDGKRERTIRWGPRTIDIDIIAFDGFESSDPQLEIPHPRATERAFVMVPLAEIAPELVLKNCTVRDWADDLDGEEIELDKRPEEWWLRPRTDQSGE